jgi:hypothetical protein
MATHTGGYTQRKGKDESGFGSSGDYSGRHRPRSQPAAIDFESINHLSLVNLVNYATKCGDGVWFTPSPDGGAFGVKILMGDTSRYCYSHDPYEINQFVEYWYQHYKVMYLKMQSG